MELIELTKEQKELIDKDLEELFIFYENSGLKTDNFDNWKNSLKVKALIDPNPQKFGIAEHSSNTIGIAPFIMNNELKRKLVLHHEIGHLLFDYGFNSKLQEQLLTFIFNYNSNDFRRMPKTALVGIEFLREYINEKFSTWSTYSILNKNVVRRSGIKLNFSGNYEYSTTFDSVYGVIESIGDDLINKIYPDSNIKQVLIDCLNTRFYNDLFKKYNSLDVIVLLEQLGIVYKYLKMYLDLKTPLEKQEYIEENKERIDQTCNLLKSIGKHVDNMKPLNEEKKDSLSI